MDGPVEPGDGNRMIAAFEPRLSRVETDVRDVKADLAEKPSQTYMWGILAALLAAYACGMGALAVLLK